MYRETEKSYLNISSRVLFLAGLVFLVFSLLKGWHGDIIDLHGFRQTQTALTVQYLLKGGPWLAYETPVLGPPWSIPFEFPLYQWLAALIAKTGIFSLDQSGRVVSVFMFLATLYPFYRILKALKLKEWQIFPVLTLYCVSPEYIFWSRTFMIESTALCLSMYFLMFIILYVERRGKNNRLLIIGMMTTGVLAATVKITTYYAFFVAAVSYFAWQSFLANGFFADRRKRDYSFLATFFIFAVLIPVLALFAWTSYSDYLKSLNPLARNLTSTALTSWNFGTLSDKISLRTWLMFFNRTIPDLIGNRWLLLPVIPAFFLCRRKRIMVIIFLLLLFLLPLVTFTNLHYRHNYYVYANGIFLITAIGLICVDLLDANNLVKRLAGLVIFCAVIGFSTQHYLTQYFPRQGMTSDHSFFRNEMDRNISGKDDIIVVFGADWNSEIPYYLQRRTVMFQSDDLHAKSFQEMVQNLKTYRIGAILFFKDARFDTELIKESLAAFHFPWNRMKNYGSMYAYFND